MSWSPTQKTLEWCRKHGYVADVVERVIPKTYIRKDLYGFLDILAIREGEVLGIQACRRADISTRRKKIESHENLSMVLASGIKVQIHGWERRKDVRIVEVGHDHS